MEDVIDRFAEWFKRHGGHIDPNIEFYGTPDAGVSCRVKPGCSPPAAGASIIECPLSISLSSVNGTRASDEFQQPGVHLPSKIVHCGNTRLIAALTLCAERLLGEKSFWYDYISILPGIPFPDDGPADESRRGIGEVDAPLWWTETEKTWLEGTNVQIGCAELLASWVQVWDDWEPTIRDWCREISIAPITWELFKWAQTICASRSFSASLLKDLKVGEHPLLDKHNPNSILCPGIDMLNHNPETRNRWRPEEKSAVLVYHDQLQPNGEIFNTYGCQDNGQLLLSWGFAIKDNPYDRYGISTALNVDLRLIQMVELTKANKSNNPNTINSTAENSQVHHPLGHGLPDPDKAIEELHWRQATVTNEVLHGYLRLTNGVKTPMMTPDSASLMAAALETNIYQLRRPDRPDDESEYGEFPTQLDQQSNYLQGCQEALLTRLAVQAANHREKFKILKWPEDFEPLFIWRQIGARNRYQVAELLKQKLTFALRGMPSVSQWANDEGTLRSKRRKATAHVYQEGQLKIIESNLNNMKALLDSARRTAQPNSLPPLVSLRGLFTFMLANLSFWDEFIAGFAGSEDIDAIVEYIEETGSEELFLAIACGAIGIYNDEVVTKVKTNSLLRMIDDYTKVLHFMDIESAQSEAASEVQEYVYSMRALRPESKLWNNNNWDNLNYLCGICLMVVEESMDIMLENKTVELVLCTTYREP